MCVCVFVWVRTFDLKKEKIFKKINKYLSKYTACMYVTPVTVVVPSTVIFYFLVGYDIYISKGPEVQLYILTFFKKRRHASQKLHTKL